MSRFASEEYGTAGIVRGPESGVRSPVRMVAAWWTPDPGPRTPDKYR
jgi:hypothetical protein